MPTVDPRAALRHLRRVDPVLGAFIRRFGPCALTPERGVSPHAALTRAVAHQQLHGRAAEAIFARFLALYSGGVFPDPAAILATDMATLRATGFSAAKIATIRAISEAAEAGIVPTLRAAARLSDEALIERLTSVRGIGRWTVEMLLIFNLGRPDVLPVDDFGIREGYRLLHGLAAQPKPRALAELGAIWAPHRSVAAWYLWRRAAEARANGKAAKAVKPAPTP
ncbi:MAG TPA: DNA-3-methyladenine glycosylase 2 family protein [Acetobacteraceae bacterium]|nr:DNA-3-methyladenine glycosylase 2 family protein [Acetobacteraceae bacterium]